MNFTVCNDIFKIIYRLVHRYDYMSNSFLYHEHIILFFDKMVYIVSKVNKTNIFLHNYKWL